MRRAVRSIRHLAFGLVAEAHEAFGAMERGDRGAAVRAAHLGDDEVLGALADDQIAGDLIAAVGRHAGGHVATVPRGAAAVRDTTLAGPSSASVHAILAADMRGMLCVACYEAPDPAVMATIEALGLSAPLLATPVLRGTARVRPGESIAAAAPIALSSLLDAESVDMALAAVRAPDAERSLGALLRSLAGGAPLEAAVRGADARALGVVRGTSDVMSIGD